MGKALIVSDDQGTDQTVSSAGYKGGVVSCNWGDKITTIKCGIPQA